MLLVKRIPIGPAEGLNVSMITVGFCNYTWLLVEGECRYGRIKLKYLPVALPSPGKGVILNSFFAPLSVCFFPPQLEGFLLRKQNTELINLEFQFDDSLRLKQKKTTSGNYRSA